MVRVEPQAVDLERWPALAPPSGVPGQPPVLIAQALRRSARELGLRIDYPDASAAGEYDAPVRVVLREPEHFWARLAVGGVVGLGESFMAGDWTTPDLCTAIATLAPWIAANADCAHPGERAYGRDGRGPVGGGRRRGGPVTVELEDSVPGALTSLYTDETMSTSGAVFASGARTRTRLAGGTDVVHLEAPSPAPRRADLGDAQRRSADTMLTLAGVEDGSHVIVATPGWGELPMRAAERGAHVRTMTASTERLSALGSRFAAAGLDEEISLFLGAPSDAAGTVDAVVAAEPGTTAGRAGHDEVIGVADRLLGAGGRLVIHTTVAPGRPNPAVVELAAWESRYVSEAGPPVAWSELVDAIERAPRLTLRGRVETTAHHAETVRLWSETFAQRGRDAAALGFDAVYRRMWAFHLAVLEAGLRTGWTESVQVLAAAEGAVSHRDGRGTT
ncbi:class I SAM-dependent methyltransferase [Dietzia cinnamea]|uniref:Class I SAM-dependent methyltransferase n=1 Tax=Dietzia cinnamea TaxID=321318 RepID=A0ABV3YKI6_9ACTN|nr:MULTISPECIES: class I SAM-dependent methyltransferase [Dietzia]KZO60121.1 cyclopropane fatty acid synthase [Dietzia maris]MCT1885015.1 class I SAM-dependent methyltransferase [Dietzia cinnamea]MCT2099574.1 class I SAM-dependent methyltransferase [Dietzia cinnamea]MCT2120827.1 class I SAM-dependent methyltransferase [Dietzia cinnamea]MCT2140193.1 class I SAM-dependent methyltransferase [Dietzia cinnamea]